MGRVMLEDRGTLLDEASFCTVNEYNIVSKLPLSQTTAGSAIHWDATTRSSKGKVRDYVIVSLRKVSWFIKHVNNFSFHQQ